MQIISFFCESYLQALTTHVVQPASVAEPEIPIGSPVEETEEIPVEETQPESTIPEQEVEMPVIPVPPVDEAELLPIPETPQPGEDVQPLLVIPEPETELLITACFARIAACISGDNELTSAPGKTPLARSPAKLDIDLEISPAAP